MQQSLTKTRAQFDRNLRDFTQGKIPCALLLFYPSLKNDGWLRDVAENRETNELLRRLHADYGILPAPVLLILFKAHSFTGLRKLEKPSRVRQKDIEAINRAVATIETYSAGFTGWHEEQQVQALHYLRWLAGEIAAIGRQKKTPDIRMRLAAQTLQQFFRQVAGRSLNEDVGWLLHHALGWPRSKGDLRLAALQRAKGPRINAVRMTVREALDLQNQNYTYWREYLANNPGLNRRELAKAEKVFLKVVREAENQFPLRNIMGDKE